MPSSLSASFHCQPTDREQSAGATHERTLTTPTYTHCSINTADVLHFTSVLLYRITYRMTLAISEAYFRSLFWDSPPPFNSASLRRSMLSARITMATSPLVGGRNIIQDTTRTDTRSVGLNTKSNPEKFTTQSDQWQVDNVLDDRTTLRMIEQPYSPEPTAPIDTRRFWSSGRSPCTFPASLIFVSQGTLTGFDWLPD